MNYFFIEPEVAGGLGQDTIIDNSVHPPKIDKLHYSFDGWLGDVLLESFPCYIVTKDVADKLMQSKLTGFYVDKVETSVSEKFIEIYSMRALPTFCWLKVIGTAGQDDFGMAEDLRLVVSEQALTILQSHGIQNAIVEPA